MSYIHGIGSSQQFSNTTDAIASSSASKAAKTDLGPVSGGSQAGASSAVVDGASVSVTAGAVAQALSGSDVRTDKVSSLQQLIAEGTYNVSSSDVAGRVLSALLS